MWKSKPRKTRIKQCKLPGFLSTILAPSGSVWSCPRCGDEWVVTVEESLHFEDPEYLRKRLVPVNPRSLAGCGSWSCVCGPHPEQMWNYDTPGDDTEYPLLCMEHRRHLPCRRCK